MKKRCYIAGAGELYGLGLPGVDDYVIAADGGYAQLMARGVTPDLVVGDFDSLGAIPDHPNVLHSPAEKNDTDMMLAVRQGLALGYKVFLLDGGQGGRLDHTVANIQTLASIARCNARGVLLGRDMCVTAVTNGRVGFRGSHPGVSRRPSAGGGGAVPTGYVSVFCAGDKAEGVTLTGFRYLLDKATLTHDDPLGVSNEFTGAPAAVSVQDGTLIITWAGGLDLLILDI